jgi:hypothetical protein
MVSSGLLRRVALVRTDVSEEPGASCEEIPSHSHRHENLKSYKIRLYYCQTIWGLHVLSALSDVDGSVVNNYCWASPAHPLSGEGLRDKRPTFTASDSRFFILT